MASTKRRTSRTNLKERPVVQKRAGSFPANPKSSNKINEYEDTPYIEVYNNGPSFGHIRTVTPKQPKIVIKKSDNANLQTLFDLVKDVHVNAVDALQAEGLSNKDQRFFYVILANPYCSNSNATEEILNNLELFDSESGVGCDFHLAGFVRGPDSSDKKNNLYGFEKHHTSTFIDRIGGMTYDSSEFAKICKDFRLKNTVGWEYIGECELLLLGIDENGKILPNEFWSYNLDDIVRNNENVTRFILDIAKITKSSKSKQAIKRCIDTLYSELIIPSETSLKISDLFASYSRIFENEYRKTEYCFLSYSSKNFAFVKSIKDKLEKNNITCWMAPFDIPRGTTYPFILELAIKNAHRFLLLLSPDSVESVWVSKEVTRAIANFQKNHPEKLCFAWVDNRFSLEKTPFEYLLADLHVKDDVELKKDTKNIQPLIESLIR